jgi:large subunit ribosomal protein L25
MRTLNIKKRNLERKLTELRKNDLIPGTIYGSDDRSKAIRIPGKELRTAIKRPGEVYKVKTETGDSFVKLFDIQKDPVKDKILHFSLIELPRNKESKVRIPLNFEGTPEGVKKGGVFIVLKNAINVYGKVNKIPNEIIESVKQMEIGDTLRVKDLSINPTLDVEEKNNAVIAICQAPMKVEEEINVTEMPVSIPKVRMAGA